MNLKLRKQLLEWKLTPQLEYLREKARQFQAGIVGGHYVTAFPCRLAEAKAWLTHTPEEDWLLWRARRTAERLKALPISLEPGELIVGKVLFSSPGPEEEKEGKQAEKILATVPAFPGGDSGHFHPDYEKVFRIGLGGLKGEILSCLKKPGLAKDKEIFYQACLVALEGLITYVHRTAYSCQQMALKEKDNQSHWKELGQMCHYLASQPPKTFHQALQLLFLLTIGLWFGDDKYLTCPGRMDRLLWPFYRQDRLSHSLTVRKAFDLICALFIQYNRILGPGSAISTMVGGRYSEKKVICNDLTYLVLAARRATKLVYPTVGLAYHKKLPKSLIDFCLEILATGVGDPAFFNDEVIVRGLRKHGVSRKDSFHYMNSTCVEIKVAGRSNIWVTAPYFNLPAALLEVIAEKKTPASFSKLCHRLKKKLALQIRQAANQLEQVWQKRSQTGCFPLTSCFVSDCLKRGLDFDRGGARYHWVENSFVGLANLVDSLFAIKHLVYQKKWLTLPQLCMILRNNFSGEEKLRSFILHRIAHYGNDNDRADRIAKQWADFLIRETEKWEIGGHRYVPGFFCWVMHERFGRETIATPDGRLSGWPLADGAGASQGKEMKGPTAAVLSTTRWKHEKVLGGLVQNLKFSATLLASFRGRQAVRSLIETYLRKGGFEIQVNVVPADILRQAQKYPERYQDLLVRVAGYSDYFVHLPVNLQEEIIARTEHERI